VEVYDILNAMAILSSRWSFGGFLAPRAAAFEKRIAALIADPRGSAKASGRTAPSQDFVAIYQCRRQWRAL
jgi:hypothetical protein